MRLRCGDRREIMYGDGGSFECEDYFFLYLGDLIIEFAEGEKVLELEIFRRNPSKVYHYLHWGVFPSEASNTSLHLIS